MLPRNLVEHLASCKSCQRVVGRLVHALEIVVASCEDARRAPHAKPERSPLAVYLRDD